MRGPLAHLLVFPLSIPLPSDAAYLLLNLPVNRSHLEQARHPRPLDADLLRGQPATENGQIPKILLTCDTLKEPRRDEWHVTCSSMGTKGGKEKCRYVRPPRNC